jgi:hypothetical protein
MLGGTYIGREKMNAEVKEKFRRAQEKRRLEPQATCLRALVFLSAFSVLRFSIWSGSKYGSLSRKNYPAACPVAEAIRFFISSGDTSSI